MAQLSIDPVTNYYRVGQTLLGRVLRTWPAKSNNGAIFFNVVPIQENPWEIKPGATIRMRYLLLASDAKPERKALDDWWAEWTKDGEQDRTTR